MVDCVAKVGQCARAKPPLTPRQWFAVVVDGQPRQPRQNVMRKRRAGFPNGQQQFRVAENAPDGLLKPAE
jgi:hypothetical protein